MIKIMMISAISILALAGCDSGTDSGEYIPEEPVTGSSQMASVIVPAQTVGAAAGYNETAVPFDVTVRRNPFLSRDEEAIFSKESRELLDNMNLSGVFYSPPASYAIIDGRIVKESEIVEEKQVVRIDQEEVVLRDSYGNEYVVRIKHQ